MVGDCWIFQELVFQRFLSGLLDKCAMLTPILSFVVSLGMVPFGMVPFPILCGTSWHGAFWHVIKVMDKEKRNITI